MGCNSPGSTHHRACDCRESAHAEEVARLRAENARLREALEPFARYWQAKKTIRQTPVTGEVFAVCTVDGFFGVTAEDFEAARRALAADRKEGEK